MGVCALNLLLVLIGALQIAPEDVLARAKPQLLEAVGRLPNYTCTETVDRSYSRRRTPVSGRASCDQLLGEKRGGRVQLNLAATDRLRLDVAIADSGREIYSWPGARRIELEEAELLTGGGPFGSGPFGPFLIDIFTSPGVSIEYSGDRRKGGMQKARTDNWFEYRFRVPLSSSHYQIKSGLRRAVFAYDGSFWLDSKSAELKRLLVRTTELPAYTGACEATTIIDFSRVILGRNEFSIPVESRLQFVMRNGDESENVTRLSNCHEYVSESVVRFGEGDEPKAGVESDPTATPKPLPPGLAVALRLETEIDTDVAAVGDPVIAKVARDVVTSPGDTSARLVVPAGAIARGRIIKLEHNIEGRSYFLIALRFEMLDIGGAVVPLNVKLPRKVQSGSVFWDVKSRTSFPETGTLVFRTRAQKHVLPKGYESTWMTFNPKG